jgi:hypothetical protein
MILCWMTGKPSIELSRWGLDFRVADEVDTICGQANSAAIEEPMRHNSSSRWPSGLMLGADFLALRAEVDVAEEFGKRVRA